MRGRDGFTMIEILVVMAILGVLAAAVMPLGETLLTAQKERELRAGLWQIRTALDDYKAAVDQGWIERATVSGYPPTLQVLVDGVPDKRAQREGMRLYLLRRLPSDPFADPSLQPALTWRLRSYVSPPDAPKPGADVFDIRSVSDAVGLDGTQYSTW